MLLARATSILMAKRKKKVQIYNNFNKKNIRKQFQLVYLNKQRINDAERLLPLQQRNNKLKAIQQKTNIYSKQLMLFKKQQNDKQLKKKYLNQIIQVKLNA